MVKKDVLLKHVQEDLTFEEETTHKLADFYSSLQLSLFFNPKDQKAVLDAVNIIKNDTLEHKEILDQMIDYLNKSDKNEF